MGLLEGIRVVRSSDPAVRTAACDITECFVDVPHGGEIVRARLLDGALKLHEGGESYTTVPLVPYTRAQVSRDIPEWWVRQRQGDGVPETLRRRLFTLSEWAGGQCGRRHHEGEGRTT